MSNSLLETITTEFDAAVMLFCLTALADGHVKKEELAQIYNEVDLLRFNGFEDIKEYQVSNWTLFIQNLHHIAEHFSFETIKLQLPEIADKITDRNVQSQVLSAIWGIAHSDSEYHDNEKNLADGLADYWEI